MRGLEAGVREYDVCLLLAMGLYIYFFFPVVRVGIAVGLFCIGAVGG